MTRRPPSARPRLEGLESRVMPVVNPARGYNPAPSDFLPAVCRIYGENTFTGQIMSGTGTLIAPQYVLTVAHVISGIWTEELHIVINGREYRAAERIAVTNLATGIPDVSDLEIGMIKLAQPVYDVQPIPILRSNLSVGEQVYFVGYGRSGTSSNPLREAPNTSGVKRAGSGRVDALANSVYGDPSIYQARFDGAQESSTGRGDSGGPMLVFRNNRYFVAGLTSRFSSGAWQSGDDYGAQVGAVSNYLRTSFFGGWIDDVMNTGSYGDVRSGVPGIPQQPGAADITSPIFTTDPVRINTTATSPAGAVVNFPDLEVTDNFDVTPTITYSHPSGSVFPVGTTVVTATARDDSNNLTIRTFEVVVAPGNPLGVSDRYLVDRREFEVPANRGLLANDVSPLGRTLTVLLETTPAFGILSLSADGSFRYIPNRGFTGTDSFTYRISDGVFPASAPITVYLDVTVIPSAGVDRYLLSPGTTLSVSTLNGLLANDASAYGNTLTVDVVRQPANGILTAQADGSFVYVPNAGYRGLDTFAYRPVDGSLYGTETEVFLRVNSAPEPQPDTLVFPANKITTLPTALLGNDLDADNDPLQPILVSGTTQGFVYLFNDGSVYYEAPQGFLGSETFTYQVTDGFYVSGPVSVTIVVEKPPEARSDSWSVPRDQTFTISASNGLLVNDLDPYGRPLQVELVRAPQGGGLTLRPDGSFDYRFPNLTGQPLDISFSYRVNNGALWSDPVEVTLHVFYYYARPDDYFRLGFFETPIAPDSSFQPWYGYELPWNDMVVGMAPGGITVGDLRVELVASSVHGTLNLQPNGRFTYIPPTGFHGSDTFSYRLTDGTYLSNTAEVRLAVRPRNPSEDSYSTSRGGSLNVSVANGLLANDFAGSGPPLHVQLAVPPQVGNLDLRPDGSFTWIPPTADYEGIVKFAYQVHDGTSSSEEFAWVRLSVADIPIAVPDTFTFLVDGGVYLWGNLMANDIAPPGKSMWVEVVDRPTKAERFDLFYSGQLTYTPKAGFTGTDTFTYRTGTSVGYQQYIYSEPVTVTIRVKPAPEVRLEEYRVPRDGRLVVGAGEGLLSNDQDAWGDPLRVTYSSTGYGTATVNPDGSFQYVPRPGFVGIDSISYGAGEGYAVGYTYATIRVGEPPLPQADRYRQVGNGWLEVPASAGLLANDQGQNGTALKAVILDRPTQGSLVLNADGSFTYYPSYNFDGAATFTYVAVDGNYSSDPVTVTIQVDQVPDPVMDRYTWIGGGPREVSSAEGVLANDSVFGSVTVEMDRVPANGTLMLWPDGSFVYTPNEGFFGIDTFFYRVLDGDLRSQPELVELTIRRPTVAIPDSYELRNGISTNYSNGVLANDSGESWLSAELVSEPAHGQLWFYSDGTFTYIPEAGYFGADQLTYRARSGHLLSDIAQVTLNVLPQPPQSRSDRYTVPGPAGLVVPASTGVLANDTSLHGTRLSAELVTPPLKGSLTLQPDGSFRYQAFVGASGIDSFTYCPVDNGIPGEVVQVLLQPGAALRWTDLRKGDFDGDRKVDQLGRLTGAGQWWVTTGAARPTTSLWMSRSSTETASSILVGDLNGDGRTDLLRRIQSTGQWLAHLAREDNFQTVVWTTWSPRTSWVDIRLADFNADGKLDLLGRNLATGQWWVGLSAGTAAKGSIWGSWPAGRAFANLTIADLNHDGRADLVAYDAVARVWRVGLATGSRFQMSTTRARPPF
ncbi:MAG: Ig-like domain-containing protein [Gemmataceae bacterium]